ncbi:MAG: hypothetical protein MI717_05840 [Spirochaetales bacterium]|nr:hypothetical protein [Spirochaetales bacterium]
MKEKPQSAKRDVRAAGFVLILSGLVLVLGSLLGKGGLRAVFPAIPVILAAPLVGVLVLDWKRRAWVLAPLAALAAAAVLLAGPGGLRRLFRLWMIPALAGGGGFVAAWALTKERLWLTCAAALFALSAALGIRGMLKVLGLRVDRSLILGLVLALGGLAMVWAGRKKGPPNNSPKGT